MARLLETDSLSNQNISAATAIGSHTATATRLVHVRVAVDQVAGNGNYIVYPTLRIAGSGSAYVIIPKTTAEAASGETALMFAIGPIPMDNADVLTIYIDGLAGDTATPDTRVDFYEQDYLRPTVAGRTLDVSAGGEAGVDWANVGSPTTTLNLSGTSTKANETTPPTASANATEAAAAILATPANKLATDASGAVLAFLADTAHGGVRATLQLKYLNVTDDITVPFIASDLTGSVNAVAAPVTVGGADAAGSQALRDAMKLAPSTSAPVPAAGSVDKHLDDLLTATAAIQAITDDLDVTAVTQVAASSAGHLIITAGLTFDEAVTGLTIPADWTTAIWTLKHNAAQADTAAVIQLRVSNPADGDDGLQRLNGVAVAVPITAADGTLTVEQSVGRIGLYLSDELTVLLSKATGLGWDVKFIDADGDSTGRRGTVDVVLTETQALA